MAFFSSKKNSKRKNKTKRTAKVVPINIKSQYRTIENRQMPTRTNDLLYTEPLMMDTPYNRQKKMYKRKKPKKNKYFFRRLAVISVLLLILSVLAFGIGKFLTRNNATEVLIDGISIGIIKDKTIKGTDLLATAISQLENEQKVKIQTQNKITTKLVHASKNTVSSDYVITSLRQKLTYKVLAAIILIDSVNKAVVKNKEEAEEILQELQNEYIKSDGSSESQTGFVENVTISEAFMDESDIMSREKIFEILKSFNNIDDVYVVLPGDSLSLIASKNSMPLSELLAVNPSYEPSSGVWPGDELKIVTRKPLLSVKVTKTEVKTEVIPKKIEYQDDNTLPKGFTRVIQEGSDGQREVTYETTIVNGVEEKKIIDEKEPTPQVPQIIQRGTK